MQHLHGLNMARLLFRTQIDKAKEDAKAVAGKEAADEQVFRPVVM